MSLVGEQERRNLAAVGATRAAAMLASVAYGQEPAEPAEEMAGPQLQGVPIARESGEKAKLFDASSGQQGKQIRTEKVANMADKGHPYTHNSVRKTEAYLSYVLHKDGIGKVCYTSYVIPVYSVQALVHTPLFPSISRCIDKQSPLTCPPPRDLGCQIHV